MFLREAAGAEVDAGVAAVAAAGGTEGDCATASGTREALRARDWGLCMVLLAAETAEPPRLGSLRAAIVFFGREGGGKRGMRLAGVEVPRGMQRKKNCAPSLTRPRHLCHCDTEVSSPLRPPPPQQEEERPTGALLLLSSSLSRALASFRRVSSREFELRLSCPREQHAPRVEPRGRGELKGPALFGRTRDSIARSPLSNALPCSLPAELPPFRNYLRRKSLGSAQSSPVLF